MPQSLESTQESAFRDGGYRRGHTVTLTLPLPLTLTQEIAFRDGGTGEEGGSPVAASVANTVNDCEANFSILTTGRRPTPAAEGKYGILTPTLHPTP